MRKRKTEVGEKEKEKNVLRTSLKKLRDNEDAFSKKSLVVLKKKK